MGMKTISSFFALIAIANASKLDSILQSKEQAATKLRARRGISDPDEWCGKTLKNPSCWEEFAETVWKPGKSIFGSTMVSKDEGWPLYWCVKKCNSGDFWKDFVGIAHEEKREKKEEYCESMPADSCKIPDVGCPQCCEKIPKSLRNLEKVKKACPNLYSRGE